MPVKCLEKSKMHSLTHSLTNSLTHSLTHSLYTSYTLPDKTCCSKIWVRLTKLKVTNLSVSQLRACNARVRPSISSSIRPLRDITDFLATTSFTYIIFLYWIIGHTLQSLHAACSMRFAQHMHTTALAAGRGKFPELYGTRKLNNHESPACRPSWY